MRWLAFALILAPGLASAQDAFQTPSGNIHCGEVSGAGWVRCDILHHSFTPAPRPPDCELDYGRSVEIWPKGPVRMNCHGDTNADPRAPVLGYSQVWERGGVRCVSAESGLRCTNAEGRGVELSRARLRRF